MSNWWEVGCVARRPAWAAQPLGCLAGIQYSNPWRGFAHEYLKVEEPKVWLESRSYSGLLTWRVFGSSIDLLVAFFKAWIARWAESPSWAIARLRVYQVAHSSCGTPSVFDGFRVAGHHEVFLPENVRYPLTTNKRKRRTKNNLEVRNSFFKKLLEDEWEERES